MRATGIVPAAGQGVRLGTAVKKQYLPLRGIPVLARTLIQLGRTPGLARLVVSVPPGEEAWVRFAILDRLALATDVELVAGGADRQESVRRALARAEAELVVVHDAVRPFVPPALVAAVLAAAGEAGAATAALPVADTIKLSDGAGGFRETLPRDQLWVAQTPQAFQRALLCEAHERARRDGVRATDDCALVERLGRAVRSVPGSPRNLKLTTVQDLALAEFLLGAWADGDDAGRHWR
jgi:2-C-methyl-D-erythritol 4-phosphate cytidylyltransferase